MMKLHLFFASKLEKINLVKCTISQCSKNAPSRSSTAPIRANRFGNIRSLKSRRLISKVGVKLDQVGQIGNLALFFLKTFLSPHSIILSFFQIDVFFFSNWQLGLSFSSFLSLYNYDIYNFCPSACSILQVGIKKFILLCHNLQ